MIFIACRSGDFIQAFIGLWLVPRYVGQNELGAVLPLQQLCGLFSVPLAIVATVFAKFVNKYATRGEYGKVKSFIHDILLSSIILLLICIVAAYALLPHFYIRLNIASGMLTILILVAGFMGNISQLFNNALQGLKKFKTITAVNLISAPIRLVTLIIAMPFRALSGYILGQSTPPTANVIISVISLHKDLGNIQKDTSWRSDIKKIIRYTCPVAIYIAFTTLFSTIMTTVYRQRLPEVDSAAFYILSRFAEIAGYVGCSTMLVLFPLAAEAHEKGNDGKSMLVKALWGTIIATIILSSIFAFTGKSILRLTSEWSAYIPFAYLLPLLTLITGIGSLINNVVSYEIACERFAIATFVTISNFIWTIFLVSFAGISFFRGIISDEVIIAVNALKPHTLPTLTYCYLIFLSVQITITLILLSRERITKRNED